MFQKVVLILLFVFTSFSSFAKACDVQSEVIMPASDDRWVPWPWALALPFPWGDIQGIWRAEDGDFVSYFAFKVVKERTTGIKQLQVKQYDADYCKVIAKGVGIERNGKVFAQMTSRGGIVYRVQLTSFDEKDAPIPPLTSGVTSRSVMVLSMGTIEVQGIESMVHMQITKMKQTGVTQKICY